MSWESRDPAQWLKEISENPAKHPPYLVHQPELPRLPVPDLDATLDKYLVVVKPVLSDDEYKKTEAAVNEFRRGQGRTLQQRLLEHEENCKKNGVTNWLKEWWLVGAYLSDRVPIAINSNVFAVVRNHPLSTIQKIDPLVRMAGTAYHTAEYRQLLERQQIPIDYSGKRPLCMDQNTRVYSTVRIPGEQCDHLLTYGMDKSRHLVLLVREHFFQLDSFDAANKLRPVSDLQHDIEDIVALANSMPEAPPISTFTYSERTFWAKARQKLVAASEGNRKAFEAIDTAIGVFVLDGAEPQTNDDLAHQALNGEGHLRWFDKSSQTFFFKNGRVAHNAEHSPYDAPASAHGNMSWVTANETADEYIKLCTTRRWDYSKAPKGAPTSGAGWRYLPIDVPASVHEDLKIAVPHARSFSRTSEIRVLEFDRYGMDFIRRVAKQSPDSWVQMALQIAFFRLHHAVTPVYETQMTRAFRDGRTETGRSLSADSVKMVHGFDDKNLSAAAKFRLVRDAVQTHVKYMLEAGQGKGIDRHLLGLRFCLKPGDPTPSIFSDAAYAKAQDYRLSTSNMTPGVFWEGGFGAYLPHGYGCCYGVRPHMIWVSIATRTTCPDTSSERFRSALRQVFIDMQTLTLAAVKEDPKVTDVPNLKEKAKL